MGAPRWWYEFQDSPHNRLVACSLTFFLHAGDIYIHCDWPHHDLVGPFFDLVLTRWWYLYTLWSASSRSGRPVLWPFSYTLVIIYIVIGPHNGLVGPFFDLVFTRWWYLYTLWLASSRSGRPVLWPCFYTLMISIYIVTGLISIW